MKTIRPLFLTVIFLTLGVIHSNVCSEGTAVATFEPPKSLEDFLRRVDIELDITKQHLALDDLDKTDAINSYNDAKNALETSKTYQENERNYYEIIEAGSAKEERINLDIKILEKTHSEQVTQFDFVSLDEAEQMLIRVQSENAALDGQLLEVQRLHDELKIRPARVRDQLTEARRVLLELGNQLIVIPGATEPEQLLNAHQILLQAQRIERENEIRMLEQELLSHSGQADILVAERELLQLKLLISQEKIEIIEGFVDKQSQVEARQAQTETEKIEQSASGKHPEILQLAIINTELSQEIVKISELLAKTRDSQNSLEVQAEQIEQDFRRSKQRLEIAGLSDASGQFMSNERQTLPDLRQYLKGAKRLRDRIRKSSIAQLRLDEKLRELDDIDGYASSILEQHEAAALSGQQFQIVHAELVKLLHDQKELLKRGTEIYTNYLRALNTLDFTHKRLVDTSNQYRDFIDEHLLWIPSTEPVDRTTFKNIGTTLTWFLSPSNWKESFEVFWIEISSTPWLMGIFTLCFAVLLALGRPLSKAVEAVSARIQGQYSYRFIYTVQALILTLLIAAPLPLLFAFFGWRLGLAENDFEFAKSIASGFSRIALPLFLMQVFFNLCKSQGVAAQHLHWDAQQVVILRKNLFWLMLVIIPLLFVAAVTKAGGDASYYTSVGRMALLVITIAQSIFAYRVLNPYRGLPKNLLGRHPKGSLMNTRYLWYPVIVVLPLVVAVVAMIGYQYTAVRFMELFLTTFWLVLGMVILRDLTIAWLNAANQKLALMMAKEKRDAEKTKTTAEGMADVVDIPEVEFDQLSEQTLTLLRLIFWLFTGIGIFIIWSDVFPALAFLEDITLWKSTTIEAGEQVLYAVTLADMVSAIVLAIVVFAAAKNLPGVMEMVVLRHMDLEHGSRYAIMTITRYLIIFVGFLVIFHTIGGRWSEIQWLVAALGVGLGFGLQEIVANFISGIILLFERPIRIGDTVTVGDVTGVVSRIQIRATTITDMDRKELLVPNKMFITDKMINWSLSDPISRVVIPVGVAYQTDTALAHKVMTDTIASLPLILKEPPPSVYFIGFGDSSLDFEVRVFVTTYEDRFTIIHQIHMELEKRLRENGIEIPFPQRDVHFKNSVPI